MVGLVNAEARRKQPAAKQWAMANQVYRRNAAFGGVVGNVPDEGPPAVSATGRSKKKRRGDARKGTPSRQRRIGKKDTRTQRGREKMRTLPKLN